MNTEQVELGDRVKDQVSGLVGIAMAKNEWINKCVRFAVQPEKQKDGKPFEAAWIDVEQLKVVKKGVLKVDKDVPLPQRPNGPRDSGHRRADPTR